MRPPRISIASSGRHRLALPAAVLACCAHQDASNRAPGAVAVAHHAMPKALASTWLVGLASTCGALLAFLVARHWARERVQHLLGHSPEWLDVLIAQHGAAGLVGLRLLPLLAARRRRIAEAG